MKYKSFISVKVLMVMVMLPLITLSGCLKDSDDSNMTFLDLGILNHYGNDYMIITDAGVVLLTEKLPEEVDFGDNLRVSVKYKVLSTAQPDDSIKADYWVYVEALNEVITKEIITINEANRDTLGDAPVEFSNVWITQDFLTVYFSFYAGDKDHFFNLTYDPDEQDDPGVVVLRFRHKANGDTELKKYSGFMSFRLNSLRKEGESAVDIVFKGKQYYEDKDYSSDLVYRY